MTSPHWRYVYTFFQHMFENILTILTEMVTMLFQSSSPGFLWLHGKIQLQLLKKNKKKKKSANLHRDSENTFSTNKKKIKHPCFCNFLLNMYWQGTAEVWTLPCGKGKEQSSQTALSYMAYLDKGKRTLYCETSLTAEVHRKIKSLRLQGVDWSHLQSVENYLQI